MTTLTRITFLQEMNQASLISPIASRDGYKRFSAVYRIRDIDKSNPSRAHGNSLARISNLYS